MPSRLSLAALVAAAVLSSTAIASAQTNAGGGQVGASGVIMSPTASPQAPSAPATTGMGGASQPGAPGSTTPGRIGTGAAPSGLAGDNPSAPGFPGKVGR